MIRVLIVDDHAIVREGLTRLLQDEPDFDVLGSAPEGLAALRLAEQLKPDLMLVDLMMPGMNGLEFTRQICQQYPNIKIIILSMHADEAYVLEALRSGAMGYILKESSRTDVVFAAHEVIAGRRYLSAPLSERAIDAYVERAKQPSDDPYESLTTREREILQLITEGHTNAEVGTILSISPRTVETHRANLMLKLKLNNQAELIRFALQHGILK